MTPARFVALCSVLNLGETRVAEMTGYSRGAVKNWGRGHNAVWPPFAAWLERVAPLVQEVLARHPPPNRNRPEAPASAEVDIAEALRSLPPPLQEPREVRQAAIAAERAARQEVRPDALDHAGARLAPVLQVPEAAEVAPLPGGGVLITTGRGSIEAAIAAAEAELAADEAEAQQVLSPATLAFRAEVRRATEPENPAVLSTGPAGEVRVTRETVRGVAQPFKPPIRVDEAPNLCSRCGRLYRTPTCEACA